MAAAAVTFGGLGRFGVHYSEANKDKPEGDTNLTSRLRLQVDMSTQSDAGIELGGRFRAYQFNILASCILIFFSLFWYSW